MTSSQLPSHVMMQLAVGEELVRLGHEVFIALASRYPNPESIARLGINVIPYRYPSDVLFATSESVDRLFVDYIFRRTYGSEGRAVIGNMAADECWYMMSDEDFSDRIRDLHFDMALVEPFIVLPCSPLLPYRHGIPFVSMTHYLVPWIIRQPALPSFYALYSTLLGSSPMPDLGTFRGRLSNAVTFYGAHFEMLPMLWQNETLLRRFAPELSGWPELISKSELYMLTVDHRLDSPLPVFPNVIFVAGVTARRAEPLTGGLRDIYDATDSGVVVVSFGSIAKYMPPEIIIRFLDVFARLNETVIAKFARVPPEVARVPANVELVTWLPQNDVLGHLKTKLFVTHCGNNGQYEAAFHGVPTLGFPMFADQRWNCNRGRRHGVGLCMDVVDFTATELYDNIRRLLDDPTYGERATRMSAAWRDEPLVGRWKAAFWIDHVIKHGSEHMRDSPAGDMPLYQFLMLDVLGFGLVMLTLVGAIVTCCWCKCVRVLVQKSARSKPKTA